MPFDTTPAGSTYQTKQFKFAKELSSRGVDTSKDEDYVNLYFEQTKDKTTGENDLYLVKRDGTSSFIPTVNASSTRGMFFWESQNQLFVAVSDDIFIYNASTGVLLTTLNSAFSTSSGEVGFTEFLYDTGVVKIVATDGTTLMTISSAGVKDVGVSVDMPIHLPYPVFLDGYLFIAAANTADIWNSNLNDPLLYTAGDFITAEMLPDQVKWISRLNNYIVVAGNASIEYFWDAAIATGSPLQRNDTPIKLTGFIGGQCAIGNKIYFVGSNDTAIPNVYVLDDFKMVTVGNEAIRRHLSSITVAELTSIRGSVVSMNGHDLYAMNTGSSCYIMDLETKLWSRWAFQTESSFSFIHWVCAETTAGYKTFFSLSGDSEIYYTSRSLYQDNGTTFTCTIITDNEEFGTYRQKYLNRILLWTDDYSSATTCTLYWTKDDYQSYSSGVTVDLNVDRPSVNRIGRFRKIAFKFVYTQNQPLRLRAMEVDINMGQF